MFSLRTGGLAERARSGAEHLRGPGATTGLRRRRRDENAVVDHAARAMVPVPRRASSVACRSSPRRPSDGRPGAPRREPPAPSGGPPGTRRVDHRRDQRRTLPGRRAPEWLPARRPRRRARADLLGRCRAGIATRRARSRPRTASVDGEPRGGAPRCGGLARDGPPRPRHDQLAAALPLLDVIEHPLGGGPFRPASYAPGEQVQLRRHGGHVPSPRRSRRIVLRVERDPVRRRPPCGPATSTGSSRWDPDQARRLAGEPEVRAGAHPEPVVRSYPLQRPRRARLRRCRHAASLRALPRPEELVAGATGRRPFPAAYRRPRGRGPWPTPRRSPRPIRGCGALLEGAGWLPAATASASATGRASRATLRASRPPRPWFATRAAAEPCAAAASSSSSRSST